MSESPKPAEIEDVLSSIRRLVAGGSPPPRSGRSLTAVPSGDAAHPDDTPGPEGDAPQPRAPDREDAASARGAAHAAPATGDRGAETGAGHEEALDGPGAATGRNGSDPAADDTLRRTLDSVLSRQQAPQAGGAPGDGRGTLVLTPDQRIPSEGGEGGQEAGQHPGKGGPAPVGGAATSSRDTARSDAPAPETPVDSGADAASGQSAPRSPDGGAEPDARDGAEGRAQASQNPGRPRRSPFLANVADPGDARRSNPASENGGIRQRQGFGFGADRDDDPVRHIPLRSRQQGEAAKPSGTASPGGYAEGRPDGDGHAPLSKDGAGAARTPDGERQGVISPDFSRAAAARTHSPGAGDTAEHGPAAGGRPEPGTSSASQTGRAPSEASPSAGADPDDPSARDLPADGMGETAGDATDRTRAKGSESSANTGQAPDFEGGDDMLFDASDPEISRGESGGQGAPDRETHASADDTAVAQADSQHLAALDNGTGAGMDEQALRAMVTDIVHRELQGVLGERVSRNIRSLVQREIVRALEARDLD